MTRAEAAKINGAKSSGPKTETGKAISSKNAVKLGLTSAEVLIPGENPDEFELLLADLTDTYGPETMVEYDLVSELAGIRWRLRRLPKMEKAAHFAAAARVQNEPDAAKLSPEELEMRVWQEVTNGPEMKQVHRHETRLRRAWEKGKAELENLIGRRLMAEYEAEREAKAERIRREYAVPPAPVQNKPVPVQQPAPQQKPAADPRTNTAAAASEPRAA